MNELIPILIHLAIKPVRIIFFSELSIWHCPFIKLWSHKGTNFSNLRRRIWRIDSELSRNPPQIYRSGNEHYKRFLSIVGYCWQIFKPLSDAIYKILRPKLCNQKGLNHMYAATCPSIHKVSRQKVWNEVPREYASKINHSKRTFVDHHTGSVTPQTGNTCKGTRQWVYHP